MAYRNNKAEILIEFKQVGIKGIEDTIKSLDSELVNLKKVIENLELKPNFINRFSVLNKEIQNINDKILQFKNKLKALQEQKITPKDFDIVRKTLLDITKQVGVLKKDYDILTQSIGQTEKGIKALVQANLENLKAYTRSKTLIKGLEEEYKKLIAIKEKNERIGNLALFNKAIENRINALNFYKTKLKEIKEFKLDSNLEKELIKPLDSFRKAVQNASYPVDKLNEKLNELEKEYKDFGLLIEKRKKLMSSLFDLRILGKSEEEINKLKQKIDELFKEGIKLKNARVFDKLEADLVKFSNEAQITFKNAQKYSTLYLQALENIHKASRLPFIDSNKIAQYGNEIKQLYDLAVKTGNSQPLALLNKEIKQLVNNSLGLVKASDAFERLKNDLKKLGVNEVVLRKFEQDFQKLAEESKSLGKTTYLGLLLKDMRELKKETKNLSETERKLKTLKDTLKILSGYGVPRDTIRELTNEFNILSNEIKKTGDVTALKDFEKRLNAIVLSSKNLREVLFSDKNAFDKFMESVKKSNPQEIKLFDGLYKDANRFIKELERVKNRYMKIIQNLQTQISSRKEFANEKDIKEAQKLIEQYTKKLEELSKAQEQLKISMRTGTFNTNIFANIKKGADESVKQLNKLDLSLTKIKAKLQETSFTKFIKHITKMALGYSALYMSIYQVINVIQRGFGFIVQMNEAVGKMSAVFDISASKAKHLEERLVRLGIAYGGDIKSINEVAMALGRAGIESDKLVKVTEYVIKMSKLTGDQFETTANALITYIHNYNQAGVSIKQLADELTYVANASKLSTEDINVFSNYALATAKSANITRHFIEALAIAFSNAGFEASTIGTSIRRLGIILQDNSGAVQQFFKSLGVNQQLFAQQVSKSAKDSERMMVWLVKRLKNMSDQEFQQAVGGMEVLARQTLSAMRNQASAILEQLKVLNNGVNGELEKSNVMLETYITKWEQLKNSLGLAFSGLMQNALPVLERMITKTTEWINAINNAMPQIQKDLSNIWTIIKGIGVTLGGLVVFRGIKNLVSIFSSASVAGLGLVGVLKKIMSALTAIGAIALRNPYVLLATLAVGAFVKLFMTVKNVNEEIARSNGLLAEQQKLNSLVSQYDSLIAKKQQFKKQLAEALVNNDQERVKILTNELNKIEQQLEVYKKIVGQQEQVVKQKQEEIDKAQKYIEYQLLSAKLERLKIEYNKTNSEEISKQIDLLEKQLEKLKQFANYKPKNQTQKPISVFEPYQEKTPVVTQAVKGNVTWENLQPDFSKAVTQSKTLNQEIEKMKQNLNLMEFDVNPLEQLNRDIKDFENKFGVSIKNMKEKTKKGLIKIVSKEEVQRFQQIAEKIKYFLKQGLDVSDLSRNLNQEIDKAFKNTMDGLVKSMEISFKQAKISKDVLPQDLNRELDKFKNMMKNATNPKDVVKLEAEFLKLKLLLDKMKDSLDKNVYQSLKAYLSGLDKDFANLEGILKARIESTNSLLPKTNKQPIAVKSVDYQIKDIFNFKDFGIVESEITKLADKLRQSFNELKQISQTGRLPIKDDLLEAQKEVQRLDSLYKTYYNQRVTKEREYYNLIMQIKALRTTGYKDEEQRTQLLERKKQLENEIKGLYQKEEELKKSTLKAEIKEVKLKQKMLAIIAEMNRETKSMNNPANNILFDIQNKMYENRQKLSIVNFNTEQDKAKLDAYFANISAYIGVKEKELKQKQQQVQEGIKAGQLDSGTAGAINAYQQYQQQIELIKQYYDEKKALIQAKELEIQQAVMAGRMSEIEGLKQIEQLKTEIIKAEVEKRKAMETASLNASLSAVSGYIGQFASALDDMMRAGLLKQKKWFRVYKAMRVAQAIIDTYTSAQQAMATLPPPINFVAAGLAIATGMMRVAVIKAQKYHTGGYVDRKTANKQMGGLKDDEIPAILQKGEYVLSKEEVKAIKASGNTTPQVNVTAPTPEIVILNSVDTKAFEDYLTSRSGREIIKNVVGR